LIILGSSISKPPSIVTLIFPKFIDLSPSLRNYFNTYEERFGRNSSQTIIL
jgi:hypothetical protein